MDSEFQRSLNFHYAERINERFEIICVHRWRWSGCELINIWLKLADRSSHRQEYPTLTPDMAMAEQFQLVLRHASICRGDAEMNRLYAGRADERAAFSQVNVSRYGTSCKEKDSESVSFSCRVQPSVAD